MHNREAKILAGGHLTDTINLQQGVPQGDIISPYIFLLMVEILLIKITKTKNITGVTYALRDAMAEAFADDTTLFMKRCPKNLRYATHIIPVGVKSNPKDIICPELGMA